MMDIVYSSISERAIADITSPPTKVSINAVKNPIVSGTQALFASDVLSDTLYFLPNSFLPTALESLGCLI